MTCRRASGRSLVNHLASTPRLPQRPPLVEHQEVRVRTRRNPPLPLGNAGNRGGSKAGHAYRLRPAGPDRLDHVANGVVHGQDAAGQAAIGQAHRSVADLDGLFDKAVLAIRQTSRRHGVGYQRDRG